MTPAVERCPVRDQCFVTCREDNDVVVKTRAEADVPCGFEIAGTVDACPKKRARVEAGR